MNHSIMIETFKTPESRIILDSEELKKKIENLRGLGAKISMTMGVYDLLHIGHVKYLEKAREQGDVLVVGVDSDELTKKRKPDFKNRPLVPQQERMEMICRHADIVTINDIGDDVNILLKIVRPNVLIVSKTTKDYATKYDALKEWVGEVVELEPQAQTSTTGRFRQLAIEGSEGLAAKILQTIEDHHKENG
jgi:cytidyltransferase-like protein